jgi:hypothetical protein
MTCHEARELCSALVDDALSAEERTVLDAHLEGCAECRRELDRLRQTVALLGGIAPVRAPAGFVDRVLAAARPEPWHRRALRALSFPLRVRLPLEAAALLLVGGLAVYVFQHSPELQQAARNEHRPVAPGPAAIPRDTRTADGSAPSPPPGETGSPTRAPVPLSARPRSTPASDPADPRVARSAAPAPRSGADQAVERRAAAPQKPASAAPGVPAPAQQPSSEVGAKELQGGAYGRAAEARPGAAGEVAKTKNAEVSEEERRRAASGYGEREQKKSGGRADGARPAMSDSAQPPSPAPPAETARKAAAPAAPPSAAPPTSAPPAVSSAPPAASVAESPPPAPSQDESARLRLGKKSAEPALRSRQEIATSSAPAPQGGAHVAAVLSTSDREAALRGLADLIARVQGRELARRADGDGTVVDLLIPRAAYGEFAQGLGRLGQLAMPFQAASLPEEVRVSVRVRP